MSWLHYLVEANIYLSVFYACYCMFLNRETHYLLNRIYLLLSCVVSFIIPLIQIGILKPVEAVNQQVLVLPGNDNLVYTTVSPMQTAAPVVNVTHFALQDGILLTYLFGAVVLSVMLIIRLYKLLKLSRAYNVEANADYKLIFIAESNTAFSFFNYLFIGPNVSETETIIRHELVHIRQKHSLDIILLELLKIINWFNPLIYLLQNSLKTVHEYIADEQTAVGVTDTLSYSSFLVNNAYGISGSPISNSFFNYNLLKKRIIMLNKQRSGSLTRLKYLVAVPLCAVLLCTSTLAFSKTYGWIDLDPIQKLIVADIPQTPLVAEPVKPNPPMPVITKTNKIKPRRKSEPVTLKGYKYKEEGYLINNKADYRVIITEKNGTEKDFFKNSCTPEQLKLLKDKYGYTFPTMPIYLKLPPPPPAAAADVPAPGSPPKRLPPPPPAPPKEGTLSQAFMKKRPLLIVNNERYIFKEPLKSTQTISYTATDSVTFFEPGDPTAKAKWGNDADNGAIMLYGEVSVIVIDDFSKFYDQLGKTIRYPAVDRQHKITGKVFASFTVDADGRLQDIKVLKGPSKTLNDELIKALTNIGMLKGASPGITYNIPVNFSLSGYNVEATQGINTQPSGSSGENKSTKQVYLSEVMIVGYI